MTADGNVDAIPPEINRVLQQSVNSIVKKEGFTTHEVKKTPLAICGEGYMAIPYTIDIKGRTQNGDKEINLFVKVPIPNSTLDSCLSVHTSYLTECFYYKELSQVFKHLQTDAGVPEEERFKMMKGYEESSTEAIIMENASMLGFKTCNRMEVVKVKFIELAFEQIAKFHALGFVMQKKMPEYFDTKIRSMEHPIQFNETWNAMCKPLFKITTKALKQEIKKKAKQHEAHLFKNFEKHLHDTNSIGTMCHGDFRANNLLFKEVEGDITEVILIDYQICYYGCPANDILNLMYGCTDQQFRKTHKTRLFNHYYFHLEKFLKYFDIDVSEVYPRKELDRALKERADISLVIALYYYAVYFAPDTDIPDVTEDMTQMDYNLAPEIVKRIEEIIEEYDEGNDNL